MWTMTIRKLTHLELQLDMIAEDLFDRLDDLAEEYDRSEEFRAMVRKWLGSDVLDGYDEWCDAEQSAGVPQ